MIGDRVDSASVSSILQEVQKKFHVFHIMINGDGNPNILHGHKMVIGREEIDIIPDIIIGAIRLQKGNDMQTILRDCDPIKAPQIKNALGQLVLTPDHRALRL